MFQSVMLDYRVMADRPIEHNNTRECYEALAVLWLYSISVRCNKKRIQNRLVWG